MRDNALLLSLMREHTPQLLGVARAFAHREDEAEDLLQELWIMIHDQLIHRPANVPTRALLHTTLLNIGRSRWRRARRRESLMHLWGADLPATVAQHQADDLQLRERIWRHIADLPALQRDVVIHRVIDGQSTADTARILERAEGTIKASLHSALRKLRLQLRGERE